MRNRHSDRVLGDGRARRRRTPLGHAQLDRPTLVTLGVQLLIPGDDNHDASVAVRYRPAGTSAWRQGLALFRVRPEVVTGRTVPPQFAGSIFDLAPGHDLRHRAARRRRRRRRRSDVVTLTADDARRAARSRRRRTRRR